MTTALQTLTNNLALNFGMGDGNGAELMLTLKATAFKSQSPPSDAQMMALLIVAREHGLNPWTREIYAFPDKGGIVPIVGVDGWVRIMNAHPQFDGIDFEQTADSCTAIIYRKDRSHATRATEYLAECKRDAQPWRSHPKRMLRHKAMIQCARLAFGFGGIFEPDEAAQFVGETIDAETGELQRSAPAPAPIAPRVPEFLSQARFDASVEVWANAIASGEKTLAGLEIALQKSFLKFSDDQRTAINHLVLDLQVKPAPQTEAKNDNN